VRISSGPLTLSIWDEAQSQGILNDAYELSGTLDLSQQRQVPLNDKARQRELAGGTNITLPEFIETESRVPFISSHGGNLVQFEGPLVKSDLP
jgi:hypothetical protein